MPESPTPEESARPRDLTRWLLGAGAVLLLTLGTWLALRPDEPVPPTTTPPVSSTSSTSATTSTTVDATTTTADATTTTVTTLPTPTVANYDVVVVGDGLGGSSAAVAAARLGANVALLSPIGYLGGQAGAAGVSTMDEGSNHFVLRRSGIYGELATSIQSTYFDPGDCYFIEDSLCPEPIAVDEFLRGIISNSGVDLIPMTTLTEVIQDGNKVTGVMVAGSTYNAEVVIDATEFSDLYPMVDGLDYEVGGADGCVQDTTWLAIRAWYDTPVLPELFPPESTAQDLRSLYRSELDTWLQEFRDSVVNGPGRNPSGPGIVPWDIATETRYRALADRRSFSSGVEVPEITRTGVNYANDYPLRATAIEDPLVRDAEFRKALHKTYAFLWYLRYELGVTNWGVDGFQDFGKAQRLLWDDLIPDALERNLPPYPYVREGRRMVTVQTLGPADLTNDVRGLHHFDDSVMLGGYFSDFHGCVEEGAGQGFGLFEVPMGVFIPETVDGFMPGMVRAAGVSRLAASAVRTQPEEIWSGEAIGIIAALAARDDIEVRDVNPAAVQEHLLANDLIFFLPG
ncbi:MAG: FAD-dependent oxidoreductase [Acidimicrobiia bacterium]